MKPYTMPRDPATPEPEQQRYRNRLLAVIAVILGIAGLRESYPILMPALFAMVIVAAIWPLKHWFDRWLPSWLSYALALMALLALVVGFAAAVYISFGQVLQVLSGRWPRLVAGYDTLRRWSAHLGVPLNRLADQNGVTAAVKVAGPIRS